MGLSIRFGARLAATAIWILLPAMLESAPAEADSAWAEATFRQAEGLADAGQYEQALALYQQIIAREPGAKLSYCRAGAASAGTGDLPEAIAYYKTCKQLLPGSIEPRGELVKLYQITGDTAARDREREDLLNLHRTTTDKQTKAIDHYLRDIFPVGALNVAVWEYFDLAGPWPSRYRYFVLNDTGATIYSLALSSSTAANANAQKVLGHATKQWVFHLDVEKGNTVTTLKVFEGEPSYDAVKSLVIDAIRRQQTEKTP